MDARGVSYRLRHRLGGKAQASAPRRGRAIDRRRALSVTTVTVQRAWSWARRRVESLLSPGEEQRTGELRFPGRSPGGYPVMSVLVPVVSGVVLRRVIVLVGSL